MKKTITFAVAIFALMISLTSVAQAQTEKAYIIRRTGINGSAINFRIFIDDVLVCKIKNKQYTIQDLKPGNHTIYITSGGIPDGRKPMPVKFTVALGKSNYFLINNGDELVCSEVTESSAGPLLAKSKQVKDCKTEK